MKVLLPMRRIALCVVVSAALGQAAARGAENSKAVDDYNFAAWLYNTGKYELAVDAYDTFLRAYPSHEKAIDARFGLAQSHFHLDHFAEAARAYEAIRRDGPDFAQRAEVLFQLGQCHVALEAFALAEPCFRDVAEKHAEHYLGDWAVARRAACLTSLGKDAEAEALLKPFVKTYTAAKRAAEDLPATQTMLAKLAAAGVDASGAFLSLIERSVFTLGLAQFNQEHFADAAESFERFLALYPESALRREATFRKAQSLYRLGQHEQAAATYARLDAGDGEFAAIGAFERGLALYKAGKLKDASAAFATMAERFPADDRAPKAVLYAGTFRYELGDYEGAVNQLRGLVEGGKEPADEAAYWSAMSLFRLARHEAARAAFEAALKAYPDSAMAGDMRLGLADVQLALGDLAAAAAAFEAYADGHASAEQAPRALYSAAVALHRADAFAASDARCTTFLDRHAGDPLEPDVLFLSGENRYLVADHDGAAKRYRAFLDRKDGKPDLVARAHFRMAWMHHDAERYDDALAALGRLDAAAAGETVTAEAAYLAGLCHFEQAAYAKAIESFESYLGGKDASRFGDDALLKVGISWERAGNARKAIQALTRFRKTHADSELAPHAGFMLAERYSDTGNHREALTLYREVVADPRAGALVPYALFGQGVAAYDQGQWVDAAAAFAQLVAGYPDSELAPQAQYRQGRAFMSATQWDKAAAAFAALLKDAPKHELARSAQVNAAACYQELKRWEEASRAYQSAIADYPADEDQPRLYYELAWAQQEAGNPKASLEAFRSLAKQYPKDPLAADACFHLAEDAYKRAGDADGGSVDTRALAEARAWYEQVLTITETERLLDKVLYRIGWCRWQEGQFGASAEAFDRLVADCPESDLLADALFQSGLAHARNDQREQARTRMERLTTDAAFRPFPYRAEALIALSDYQLAAMDAAKALTTLSRYLDEFDAHGDRARAYLLKGKAEYQLADYAAALESLDQCTRLTRSAVAAEARFYIGQTHQIQQNYADALVAYLRVQALYASEAEWCAAALFESAKCYEALGQPADAEAALRDVAGRYKGTRWAALAENLLN